MTLTSKKSELRKELRAARKKHVSQLPDSIRALLFLRPPAPLVAKIAADAVIGLYCASNDEAPASGYAKFFQESGHRLALPFFASQDDDMSFAEHIDPHTESDLEVGAFGIKQPIANATVLAPDLIFVPLIGFTDLGERLGQGGGHYDRWLAAHHGTPAIGLAWDAQLCEELPVEPHDIRLDAVVTPTRMYGPF
jgi:5-formyltetrahydrofolate cyclo-ligase